jgi:hypothetical protein
LLIKNAHLLQRDNIYFSKYARIPQRLLKFIFLTNDSGNNHKIYELPQQSVTLFQIKNSVNRLLFPFLFTKFNYCFLNPYAGFLMINKITSHDNLLQKINAYQIKKTLYSFSYKNELQKFILKKYLKIENTFLLFDNPVNRIENYINRTT